MNDTTSSPDEPDGRTVTDRTDAASGSSRPVSTGDDAPVGDQPGTSTDAADTLAAAVGAHGSGEPWPATGSTSGGDGASASRTGPPAADRPVELRPGPRLVSHPAGPAGGAPPAAMRMSPFNGTPERRDESPRPLGSVATVAGPGAAAGSPPPWNRVPGQEPVEPQDPMRSRGRPVGGLLDDDGPTTFLEAPVPSDSEQEIRDPTSRSGGWSPVRPVRGRPPRQAALQLKRLDPWSVLKLALVLSVMLFLIWLIAVGVLYGVLDGIGVWDRLNGTYADLVSGEAQSGSPLISAGRVFGLAAIVGAVNSLLFAVAVTVGAFVYNVSADLVGGIEVTLSERD